jgi:hypothetical protein
MDEIAAEIREVSDRLVDNARAGVWDAVDLDARIRDELIKLVPLDGDTQRVLALFEQLQAQNDELHQLIAMEQRRVADQKSKYRRSHVALNSYLEVASGRRR